MRVFQHSKQNPERRKSGQMHWHTHASVHVWILKTEQMNWNQIRFLCIHSSFFFAGHITPHTGERVNVVNEWWIRTRAVHEHRRRDSSKSVARIPMFMIQKGIFPFSPKHKNRERKWMRTCKSAPNEWDMERTIERMLRTSWRAKTSTNAHPIKCNIHTITTEKCFVLCNISGKQQICSVRFESDRRNHSKKLSSFIRNSTQFMMAMTMLMWWWWWWITKSLAAHFSTILLVLFWAFLCIRKCFYQFLSVRIFTFLCVFWCSQFNLNNCLSFNTQCKLYDTTYVNFKWTTMYMCTLFANFQAFKR